MIHKPNKKGFVVLYTVLIAAIILTMVIGISMISYGEVILSAEAREGNIAFFAADTGAECALYNDRVLNVFQNRGPQLNCNGLLIDYDYNFEGYALSLNDGKNCAKISVEKRVPIGGIDYTRIESRGYNVSCGEIETNPRVIERAVRATYQEAQIIVPPL